MIVAAAAPSALVRLVEPWSDLFADSLLLATLVTYLHVAGLLLAGGFAIATDRATLRALRGDAGVKRRHLSELSLAHRWVVSGLGLVVASGLLLTAADLETYFGSWVYWTKMGLVALLLTNGYLMMRAERALGAGTVEDSRGWQRMRVAALASVLLWFTIALFGVVLVNAI